MIVKKIMYNSSTNGTESNPETSTFRFRFIAFVLVTILTWVSLFFAFRKDEGQIPADAWFENMMADSFLIFRFPIHTLFFEWITDSGLFVITLLLNLIIWAFCIERVYWLAKSSLKRL